MYVYLCEHVSMCVRLRVAAMWTRSCDPNSVTGDSDWCPLWTWYTSDSKTNTWNDLKIRPGFGSKTASFHVTVCSYVISLFIVVSRYLYVTRIISCNRLIYFTSVIMRIISW